MSEWISVQDKLPELNKLYIGKFKLNKEGLTSFSIFIPQETVDQGGKTIGNYSQFGTRIFQELISYIPLPE